MLWSSCIAARAAAATLFVCMRSGAQAAVCAPGGAKAAMRCCCSSTNPPLLVRSHSQTRHLPASFVVNALRNPRPAAQLDPGPDNAATEQDLGALLVSRRRGLLQRRERWA